MSEPKPSTSPARIAANRANALRSSGPKSDEGKARSRLNGLTHGLRAELPILPGEDAEALQHRLDAWMVDFRPESAVERHLVEAAVQASWRMDRCRTVETAVLTGQILHAEDDFDDRLAAESERWIASFEDDPTEAVRELRKSSRGCRWLVVRWESLGERMRLAPTLDLTEKHLALHLMGKSARQMFDDPDVRQWTAAHLAAAMGNTGIDIENVRALLWPDRPEGMHPVEFERRVDDLIGEFPATMAARSFLVGEIRRAIVELTDRVELLAEREGRDKALALDVAAFDASKAGSARLRYEMAHHRVFHRALSDLRAEQKRRTERDRAARSDTEGPAESAAIEAPAPGEAKPAAVGPARAVPRAAAPSASPAPTEPNEVAPGEALGSEKPNLTAPIGRPMGVPSARAA